MIGLTVFIFVAIYIALWWLAVRFLSKWWQRTLVTIAAIAIPFWDVPFGYYNFEERCAKEGGVHARVRFPPTDAILLDGSAGYRPEDLIRYGFTTIEYQRADKGIERLDFGKNETRRSFTAQATSKVLVQFTGHHRLKWNIVESEYLARRLPGGEVIAFQKSFYWGGTWWQVKAAPLLGYGARCGTQGNSLIEILAKGSA